ncbi:nucleolar preribosomal assembly protein, putative [Plasmodium gallinaceum]|uniref:Glutamate-rich WD repeat-containing protein 1 n=1 Tax=Plasmodium gallinaceum TaxID=5849 RepID=A0A1J1GL78_PLAGA|nr:nucleolar preribosomal assembly protein, putative [Plasmodium gallinaceum]CRG93158.1 nucleolar preribosomal assembly protein, putative [Plasmodium gallinaceum]
MNEDLEIDENAYDMFFSPLTPWPCLSFDFILPNSSCYFSEKSKKETNSELVNNIPLKYPIDICCVGGTQANKSELNNIYVIKWSNLNKLKNCETENSSDDSEYDDEEENDISLNEHDNMEKKKKVKNEFLDEKSNIICKSIKHEYGCINKIKVSKKINSLVAAWCEDSNVYIYELSDEIKNLDDRGYNEEIEKKPLHVFEKHSKEGFSLDWNNIYAAKLLTGDNDGNLYLWLPHNSDKWNYEYWDFKKYADNKINKKYSIEDIEWCKKGNGLGNVFCICSSDKSIRILDIRNLNNNNNTNINIENAHENDVNVISWNENSEFLLASGGDDNLIKIWDIRNTRNSVAQLNFHKQPITSVCWDSKDTYVLLASSLDNSITIWDLSVESEALEYSHSKYPDQLLFEHLNQNFITEAKFHPYFSGVVVSTSCDNFNIFKPCNI